MGCRRSAHHVYPGTPAICCGLHFVSRGGPGVSLALTKDFRVFEKLGVVMSPDDKDAALLPEELTALGL